MTDPNRSDGRDPVVSCTVTCPRQREGGRTRFRKSHAEYTGVALQQGAEDTTEG
jgi:hypothetical protein